MLRTTNVLPIFYNMQINLQLLHRCGRFPYFARQIINEYLLKLNSKKNLASCWYVFIITKTKMKRPSNGIKI